MYLMRNATRSGSTLLATGLERFASPRIVFTSLRIPTPRESPRLATPRFAPAKLHASHF